MAERILDRIDYDVVDGVARIELARPDSSNALDLQMCEAVREVGRRALAAAKDGSARVAVVTAQGKMFSVGGDLADFTSASDRGAHVHQTASVLHEGVAALHELPIPVLSVVHGTVAGAGLGIALCGDIVLIADEAKATLAYTKAGLTPDCGLSWELSRRLSWPRIADLMLANRVITGVEAAQWGLVSRSYPAAELTEQAEQLISTLRHGATTTFGAAKALVAGAAGRTLVDQLAVETETVTASAISPQGREGMDAFMAKRTPDFG